MLSRLMTRREQLLLAILATSVLAGAAALYAYNRHDGRPAVPIEETVVAPADAPADVETGRVEPVAEDEPLAIEIEAPPTVATSIMGAVRHPGMYEFDADSRVQDLVDAAGGVTEDADVSDINGAARLIDGSTLIIPVRGVATVADGTLVARGRQSAVELNPAQYTISGWRSGITTAAPIPGAGVESPGGLAPQSGSAAPGLINVNTASKEQLESLPGIGPKLAQEIIHYRTHTKFKSVDDLDNVSGIGPKRLEAIRGLVTAP